MKEASPYEQVKEFHTVFDKSVNDHPKPLTPEEAVTRANFSTEELLELLYASVGGDLKQFEQIVSMWQEAAEKTVMKIMEDQKEIPNRLVGQVDALIDANYFNYGSFVLMGVNPDPIFPIVHQSNMGKLFPDGKPHYRKEDGKVLKPTNWEEDHAPERKIRAEIKRQIKIKNEGILK